MFLSAIQPATEAKSWRAAWVQRLRVSLARVGDAVTCPMKGHGGVTKIVTGDATCIIDGKPVARDGDVTACGAKLIASLQNFVTTDAGGGGGSGGSASAAASKGAAAAGQSESFNDFYILHGPTGSPLANCAYAVEYPDGAIEYGTTDASGKTKIFETEAEAKALIFYRQGA